LSKPKDFTFDELATLYGHFGYNLYNAGKTSGSRVTFVNEDNDYIRLHKPHQSKELKAYQVKDAIKSLEERGLL